MPHFTDAGGREMPVRIVDIIGRSALVEYRPAREQCSWSGRIALHNRMSFEPWNQKLHTVKQTSATSLMSGLRTSSPSASSFQATMIVLAGVVVPRSVVVQAANQGETYLSWAIFAALLVSGATIALHAVRVGRFGSGHILITGSPAVFMAVCVAALVEGGPALLATLIVISTLFQFALAARLSLLRRIITPAVSGTVVMLGLRHYHADHVRPVGGCTRGHAASRRSDERRGDPSRSRGARNPRLGCLAAVGTGHRHCRGLRGRRENSGFTTSNV